jgi:mRNA-degrading endonuclease RelE of RelBE toxin-antitoxin system
MTISYFQSKRFEKDFKKLTRRFRTLPEDLALAKRAAIELFHCQHVDNRSVFRVQGLQKHGVQIYKLKKFACKALKGRGVQSGIRIIYAFCVSKSWVQFIEIYFKADQEEMDLQIARNYLESLESNNQPPNE